MSSSIQGGTYTIDAAHSNVEFAVRHMMITTVKGRFGDVKGTIEIPEQGEPGIDVTIGTASVDTRSEQRDGHLRSADFFDVEKYPEMRFVSTGAQRTSDGWKVTGNLTIKGVTKPVSIEFTARWISSAEGGVWASRATASNPLRIAGR